MPMLCSCSTHRSSYISCFLKGWIAISNMLIWPVSLPPKCPILCLYLCFVFCFPFWFPSTSPHIFAWLFLGCLFGFFSFCATVKAQLVSLSLHFYSFSSHAFHSSKGFLRPFTFYDALQDKKLITSTLLLETKKCKQNLILISFNYKN